MGPHRRADRGGLPGAGVTGPGARVGMNLLWLRPGVVGGSEEYLCRQLLGLLEIDHPFAIELFALPSFGDGPPRAGRSVPRRGGAGVGRQPAPAGGDGEHVAGPPHQAPRRRAPRRGRRAAGPRQLPCRPARSTTCSTSATRPPSRRPSSPGSGDRSRRRRRRAAVVVVPSEYVRSTVVEAFGIRADRVVVAPHGLPSGLSSDQSSEERERARRAGDHADARTGAPAAPRPHRPRRRLPRHHLPPQEPRRAGAGPGPARCRPRRRAAGAARWPRSGGGGTARRGGEARPRRSGGPTGPGLRTATATASTRWPTSWPSRAATRGSARRCWRPWRPDCRWSPPLRLRCRRWSAAPACWCRPTIRRPGPRPSPWCSTTQPRRDLLRAAGRSRAATFTAERSAAALVHAYGLAVL